MIDATIWWAVRILDLAAFGIKNLELVRLRAGQRWSTCPLSCTNVLAAHQASCALAGSCSHVVVMPVGSLVKSSVAGIYQDASREYVDNLFN